MLNANAKWNDGSLENGCENLEVSLDRARTVNEGVILRFQYGLFRLASLKPKEKAKQLYPIFTNREEKL